LQKERNYMENLTRYSPAILNNNGVAEASMVSTNVGEFVKFSDINELLQTSHNKQSDEIKPCGWQYSCGYVRVNKVCKGPTCNIYDPV
jgi:hypothetical protein